MLSFVISTILVLNFRGHFIIGTRKRRIQFNISSKMRLQQFFTNNHRKNTRIFLRIRYIIYHIFICYRINYITHFNKFLAFFFDQTNDMSLLFVKFYFPSLYCSKMPLSCSERVFLTIKCDILLIHFSSRRKLFCFKVTNILFRLSHGQELIYVIDKIP